MTAPACLLGFRAWLPYALGMASLHGMRARPGVCGGQPLTVVGMPFPKSAPNVDKPEDFALLDTILARRGAA